MREVKGNLEGLIKITEGNMINQTRQKINLGGKII